MVNRPKRMPKRASKVSVIFTSPLSSAPAMVIVLNVEPSSKIPDVIRLKRWSFLPFTGSNADDGLLGSKSGSDTMEMISPVRMSTIAAAEATAW